MDNPWLDYRKRPYVENYTKPVSQWITRPSFFFINATCGSLCDSLRMAAVIFLFHTEHLSIALNADEGVEPSTQIYCQSLGELRNGPWSDRRRMGRPGSVIYVTAKPHPSWLFPETDGAI